MTTITLNIDDNSLLERLKSLLDSMKISYEESESINSPEFVKKFKEGMSEIENGKTIKIDDFKTFFEL
jgi:hypothetical protein